ncbi:MAG: peptidyl-prolyl cis-trans isomerase [Planctomycetota bacterium]|jgi:parvulin-like peptidyl-prolyl isomerase
MEEKLDFSLPEKRRGNAAANWITIVLLLILTVLTGANLVLRPEGPGKAGDTAGSSLSSEQVKQLAGKLAQRNLHVRAAEVWQDYLSRGGLTDAERARTMFQIAALMEKASLFDKAIEFYYRSEIAAELDELKPQINAHVKECFEKLGKFSALRYELMDRTTLESGPTAGAKIVAEIGPEKITEADLDAMIESNIENQLEPVAAFMSSEQLKEQTKKMLEQYKTPQARQQYLQGWLAQEVLYRQALQEKLADKPEARKLIDQLTRGALSQLVMNNELASKINITDTDIQTYYTANKDKFVDPSGATISHILLDDEAKAKELIGRVKGGEDFGELAKEFSTDADTKDKGGKIETEVEEGSYIPGIGTEAELNKKIFAVEAPQVLDEPFKTEKGWEIVKVEALVPERQKQLDEVRQQVMSMLTNQKSQDVQRDLIKQLMDKHNVIVHTSALGGAESEEK